MHALTNFKLFAKVKVMIPRDRPLKPPHIQKKNTKIQPVCWTLKTSRSTARILAEVRSITPQLMYEEPLQKKTDITMGWCPPHLLHALWQCASTNSVACENWGQLP